MSARAKKQFLIYETVIEYLKRQIADGQLKPGDRLPTVIALAEQLSVNQASVREAYRVLQTLGVLTLGRGKGTFVADTVTAPNDLLVNLHFAERQSIGHLQEARRLLEPAVAALAAQRATPEEIKAIMAAAEELERVDRYGEDYIDPDVRFHEIVFLAAHNPVIAQFLSAIRERLVDSRRLTKNIPDAIEKAAHYHKLIAIAIKERNPEAARMLMSHHVDDVEHSYMESESSE
ncbi:MAG: FadR family transcriptional regulator [Anaerolineae bacterium]|nr:FadR family transcriptional regulator [Anaerolineae bacterium]